MFSLGAGNFSMLGSLEKSVALVPKTPYLVAIPRMNTIAFIAAGVILVIIILAKIPGLEHAVRPLIGLVFTALQSALESSVFWSIWMFKLLLGAHYELFQHLIFPAEALDPSVAVRASSEKTG